MKHTVDPADLTRQLAHEIQAPLTSIELQLNELIEELGDSDLAQSCLRELSSLRRLVTSFLELGEPELRPRAVALAPVVGAVETRFRPIADAQGVELRVTCGSETAILDVRATERILSNLVDNAIKFASERGHVDVCVRALDGSVEVEVRDDGIGIASESHDLIFEPFYRADREVAGSGLGLAISKRLAEAQHGTLRVESELGRGSSFIVTLPQS